MKWKPEDRERGREDRDALGGLRNPHEGIRRLPGAQGCGALIREKVDEVVLR